jgi:hypothetical protein
MIHGRVLSIVLPLALLAFAACSSKGPGSSSTCNGPTTQSDACNTCLAAHCASQADAAFGSGWQSGDFSGGACGSYVGCAEGCACGDTSCLSKCTPSASCTSALEGAGACEETQCASVCKSGGSAGTGGAGTGPGGAGGSGGSGGGSVQWSCYSPDQEGCIEQKTDAQTAALQKANCTQGGEVAGDVCPSAGLEGCCTIEGATSCIYQGYTTPASMVQAGCIMGGGTWATTP